MILLTYNPSSVSSEPLEEEDLRKLGLQVVTIEDLEWDPETGIDGLLYAEARSAKDLKDVSRYYLSNKRCFIHVDATPENIAYIKSHNLEYLLVTPRSTDRDIWARDKKFDPEFWEFIRSEVLPHHLCDGVSFVAHPSSGVLPSLENITTFI